MAILMRRGNLVDFDPTKILPGEWAVTIDNDSQKQMVYMCFKPGKVKRIGTYDDLQDVLDPYKQIAIESAESAQLSADRARQAEINAVEAENRALFHSDRAESYAVGTNGRVREDDETDNSKYYYNRTKEIAQGLGNPLVPKGTINFEELPDFSEVEVGWMYNMGDDFTTDNRFIEGPDLEMSAGNNVYCIEINEVRYWDILAGQSMIKVDTEIDESSMNPVQNKVIAKALASASGTKVLESMEEYENEPPEKYTNNLHYIVKGVSQKTSFLQKIMDRIKGLEEATEDMVIGEKLGEEWETPIPRDADVFGGRIWPEDFDQLRDDLNQVNSDLVASDGLKFKFSTDGEGNYGYLGADDSFIPFKGSLKSKYGTFNRTTNWQLVELGFKPDVLTLMFKDGNNVFCTGELIFSQNIFFQSHSSVQRVNVSSNINVVIRQEENGFSWKTIGSWGTGTAWYLAVG
jgi:hypothetical protein